MSTFKTNTVQLIGNLGKDPMITQFANNNSVARFSLATNESYQDKNGEWISQATWHNIVAWGKNAERCEKLLKKGTEIMLEGKITNNTYETKEGEKRYNTEIVIRDFYLIEREEKEVQDVKATKEFASNQKK
ncbi:MAG TPA: single-stranded DNA-binding protein [Brumimicrobium sp.]|nr:single-stranded DNA-binding protein [Brumimicrobium sp.]